MRIRFPHPLYEAPGGTPAGNEPPAGAAPAEAAKPTMPEGLPADYWDADKGEVKFGDLTSKLGELSTFKAEFDAKLAEVPATPDGYKFELPATAKLPDGFEWTLDDKDPAFVALRTFAHENKLPQSAVSAILGIEAARRADELNASIAFVQKEEAALGEKFPERKAAVEDFLRANLDERLYEGARARIDAGGAAGFEAIEKLIEIANNGSLPDGGGRDATPKTTAEILYPSMAKKVK